MKQKTINLLILLFTIAYVIGFGIYYLIKENYEFLWYVVILFFLIGFMIFLHRKYKFSSWILFGTSIWGLMHMAGGSVYIKGIKLYALILYPLFPESVTGTDIFRYDQLAHFYFYFVISFLIFSILNNYLNKKTSRFAVSVFVIFIATGIGALNEIIEFIPVLVLESTGVGDYFNTLWDIVFNTLGAIVSVVLLNLKRNKIS
jgi:putative membrane protein